MTTGGFLCSRSTDTVAMQTAARFSALVAGVLALLILDSRSARADELTGASSAVAPVTTRDRLYSELAADVAELEQRGNILKRSIKLATPAVGHIEARRETESARSTRTESEEAGSGVIIE